MWGSHYQNFPRDPASESSIAPCADTFLGCPNAPFQPPRSILFLQTHDSTTPTINRTTAHTVSETRDAAPTAGLIETT